MSTSERQHQQAAARTRRILHWIIWPSYPAILGSAAVFILTGAAERPEYTVLWHATGLGIVAIAHQLTRRGRLDAAANLLIVTFYLTYFSAALLSGGILSPYMGSFLLVIVGAGTLKGSSTGFALSALSVLAAVFFTVLQAQGLLPPSWMPITPSFAMVAWSVILGMTGVQLHITLGELQRALGRAERTEVALEGALAELHRTSVSKDSVETVLRSLGDAVFVLDPDETIREMNQRALELLGLPAETLIGRPFGPIAQGEGETVVQTSRGPVHVSLSRSEMRGLRGELDGVVIVAHDIDARVAAEQAVREASAAKSTFLATMSHELRTPLNAIIGYAEFVQEELEEDPGLAGDVERIERSGRDLLTLINDILDLSKIEAGRVELDVHEVDLQAPFQDVVLQVDPLVTKNRNTFLHALPEGPLLGHTDPTRLRQILRNLLSNAGKFTEDGTIHLRVEHGAALYIEVQDTGLGMTEAQLERVWKPFTQADASTTRRFGGTGLGLPITRRLCELLGGGIEADSTPGEGTTFRVHLPLTPTDRPEDTHA